MLIKENLTTTEIQDFEALNIEGVFMVTGNAYVDPTKITDPNFVSTKLQTL